MSDLLDLADPALELPGADAVEVVLSRSDSALTRFAESRVHQNTARVDGEVRVRVVLGGGRVGVASTNQLDRESVRAAAERAREAAAVTPADPGFPGLAEPAGYQPAGRDDDATAACPAAGRAAFVAAMLGELGRGSVGAGTVETGRRESAVATTTGVRAVHAGTRAAATLLASDGSATGYAEDGGTALSDLDPATLGRRAAEKVALGGDPQVLPPGDYPVVLEPAAAVELVQWLAWSAFGAKAVAEGRSPLSGRLGQRLCSPLVTVVDDPLSPLVPGVPFDDEGTPTRRTVLLDRGIAVGVAHDRRTAAAAGTGSTGHALPAPNPEGGIPRHVLLEPGTTAADEVLSGLERGLLVTRFHYTNLVHPVTCTVTGMTRDGTFLVEGGRVVGAVRDLRFTQSVVAALEGVEAVGDRTETATNLFFGAARAPHLREHVGLELPFGAPTDHLTAPPAT